MRRILEDPRARIPLMMFGMIALAAGIHGGLERIGWCAHAPGPGFAALHGPLMVCGFLGTLICTERAVALGSAWAYLAPISAGAGGLALILGLGGWIGALLLTAASVVLVAIFIRVLRIQFHPFAVVMTAGAAAWAIGNALWLGGKPVFDVVGWWMAFLVLTIAGERLELSRMLLHAPAVQRLFLVIVGVLAAGLAVTSMAPDTGTRVAGVSLVALAGWLLRNDVARRTVRLEGLTRYIAWCLLAGYFWLIVGGILMATIGHIAAGPLYDAMLHAVFVGFVFSMIFGHAPIIFPSVLGVPVAYTPAYYVHLVLLHGSLALRIGADLLSLPGLRRVGGMLNAAAIVLFLGATLVAVLRERRRLRTESV